MDFVEILNLWMKWPILVSMLATHLVPFKTEPVRISSGLVQGIIAPGGKYMMYYGIPYATVETRYQDAVPHPQWPGVLQATNKNIRCTQRFFKEPKIILGQEDCLTMNVYAPFQTSKDLLPVMVFIHGGGFKEGSGTPFAYGPEYFMKHNVILVTFNYRVDILGFLCLGIHDAPGNVGLKDQVEALKWVQNNIHAFGGNAEEVTLFGQSAGAVSVSYHLLSPMSKGLFARVIMQSGTALAPWALQSDPVGIAHKFAKQFGFSSSDLHELVKFLKDKSDRELLNTVIPRTAGKIALEDEYNFVPCIEKAIPGVDRFLPGHPYDLFAQGQYAHVPVIIGYNDEEGYWFVSKDNDTMLSTFHFNTSLPTNLRFPTNNEKEKVAKRIKDLYLRDAEISKETRREFSSYLGDIAIKFPVTWTIEKLLKSSSAHPVYAYKFTHDGMINFAKMLIGYRKYPGASHGDELSYLFKGRVPMAPTKADKDMINNMTTLWTNFAKYGEPTPTGLIMWNPVNITELEVFVLDNTAKYTMLYDNPRLEYWKKVYKNNLRKSLND